MICIPKLTKLHAMTAPPVRNLGGSLYSPLYSKPMTNPISGMKNPNMQSPVWFGNRSGYRGTGEGAEGCGWGLCINAVPQL